MADIAATKTSTACDPKLTPQLAFAMPHRRLSAYGTPSTAGRLNPIATHAPSSFSMNFPEKPG